jgi:hypothetical protein
VLDILCSKDPTTDYCCCCSVPVSHCPYIIACIASSDESKDHGVPGLLAGVRSRVHDGFQESAALRAPATVAIRLLRHIKLLTSSTRCAIAGLVCPLPLGSTGRCFLPTRLCCAQSFLEAAVAAEPVCTKPALDSRLAPNQGTTHGRSLLAPAEWRCRFGSRPAARSPAMELQQCLWGTGGTPTVRLVLKLSLRGRCQPVCSWGPEEGSPPAESNW